MSQQHSDPAETLKAILDAFNDHNVDAIMRFFADDCSLEMPSGVDPWGQLFVGKAAVREGLETHFKSLPDVHYSDDRHWTSGNMAFSEWLLIGTTPEGVPVRVRGCDHYGLRDGKVVRKDSYWKIVRTPTNLGPWRWIQIACLSWYCAAAVLLPIYYVFMSFDRLFADPGPNARHMFVAMVLMGVLGSALRGMSRLFTDVGKGLYQPSWDLSILMRPLEGAGIALVSYLAVTAGIIFLGQERPTPNTSGYLFIGILSGMFSHRAADTLRRRFDALWGRRADEQTKHSS